MIIKEPKIIALRPSIYFLAENGLSRLFVLIMVTPLKNVNTEDKKKEEKPDILYSQLSPFTLTYHQMTIHLFLKCYFPGPAKNHSVQNLFNKTEYQKKDN